MNSTNEATSVETAWPPIGRSRSPLTCGQQSSENTLCAASEWNKPAERDQSNSSSFSVNKPEPLVHDRDDDDEDTNSEEIRALTSAAAGFDDSDDSSDEVAAGCDEDRDDGDHVGGGDQSSPSGGDRLAPLPLSSSSASVLGRIASGFSSAVSGGLHPLKRSPRVAPELPSPRSPSPKDFFWGPVMPGYPTSPPYSDDVKAGQSTMVIRQTVQLEQTETSNNNSDADIGLRQAIPIMSIQLAVVCCLLNVISPGLGKT